MTHLQRRTKYLNRILPILFAFLIGGCVNHDSIPRQSTKTETGVYLKRTTTTSTAETTTVSIKPDWKVTTPMLPTKLVEYQYNPNAKLNEYYIQTLNPSIFVVENESFFFYLKEGDVYRFDKKSKDITLLYEDIGNAGCLNIYKDKLLFFGTTEYGRSLLSIDINGKNLEMVFPFASAALIVEKQFAYFYSGGLAKFNLESNELEQVYETSFFHYLIKKGDWFYYSNSYDFYLRKIDVKTNTEVVYTNI